MARRGIIPRHQILNNQSSFYKIKIELTKMTYKLVPPDNHCHNLAKKAIQTVKDHMVSVLSGCLPTIPMYLWCQLLPQIERQSLLLCQLKANPNILAHVHMCIGRDVGIGLQLAKEKQLTFDLGEKLAPKMYRHGGQASAEHADHVVLECLDGLLGQIAPMVIGGDKFVCHLGEFDLGLVRERCLVVKYLVPWDDAASGHSRKCATAGKNEFALAVVLSALL